MNCSTPGFPVHHYLLEFAQSHVHWVGNTIQPSHPLSPLQSVRRPHDYKISLADCCCSFAKLYPVLCHRGPQHTRLPCPSPSLRVCSNSCLLSQWCRPTISSSVTPFSSCLQSFQSIGAVGSASVLPMNIQDWFPLELTALISLLSKRLSRVSLSTTIQKHWFFHTQASLWFFMVLLLRSFMVYISIWLLEKTQLWLDEPWSAKWYLCF